MLTNNININININIIKSNNLIKLILNYIKKVYTIYNNILLSIQKTITNLKYFISNNQ